MMTLRAWVRWDSCVGQAMIVAGALTLGALTLGALTLGSMTATAVAQGSAASVQLAAGRHACALGLAVPVGAAKPEVASDAALRQTLLRASTIVFTGDEVSGAAFRRVLSDLGIARQIEARLLDTGNGDPLELVAQGRADLGVSSPTKIASASGVTLVPLPAACRD